MLTAVPPPVPTLQMLSIITHGARLAALWACAARRDIGNELRKPRDAFERQAAVAFGARGVRDDGAAEAELLGFFQSRRRLRHWPHRARERNLAEINRISRERRIGERGAERCRGG